MLAFRAFSARRLAGQAAALFGVALTLAAAVRWGPPGWEGPWPLRGGMATLMSGPQGATAPRVAFLTVRVVPATAAPDVVLYRDGWRVGALPEDGLRVAVHAGDTLAVALRAPMRVTVEAEGGVASPLGRWTLEPGQPALRLPLVVLRVDTGRML